MLGSVGNLAAQLAHWGGTTVIGSVRRSADLKSVICSAVAKNTTTTTTIAAYATRRERPDFPFWPMLFDNIAIRLLGSDDFPVTAKQQATEDLTAAAAAGALSITIGAPLPLGHAGQAHDRVDAGSRSRILLAITERCHPQSATSTSAAGQ